ncbi:MAG: glycosyl transferase family 41 [Selenomonadaceae bacterium]|nr:glycosyl transferase family 41 [Selenomonadaceae bacterium]
MKTVLELLNAGKPRAALARLKKLLAETDDDSEWRIHELFGATFHDLCNAEGVAQSYFNAAMTDKFLRSQRGHFSNYLFALHYLPQLDAETLANELAVYNSLYVNADTLPKITRPITGKISVAFIAPTFCYSSAAGFFESLLTDYNREKFKVTTWSISDEEDAFTEKIRRSVDGYFTLDKVSFADAAQMIRDAAVDILIDLGGHTEGGTTLQIAAYKPARLQISGIGYFDSTGLDAIDYFIGDEFLTAEDTTFTEKVLSLKNVFALRPNEKMIAERVARKKIPHENFTFGCLNNFMKLSNDYLDAVKNILTAVPNSKIIFRDTTPLESRRRELIERLNIFGIDCAEVRLGEDDFYGDYDEIDLILDTFPYTGGMMTALALYMGVPVVNMCGNLAATRTGADILRITEISEMICTNVDDYVATAVDIARDGTRLKTLAAKISADKLTDTKSFVEDFYGKILTCEELRS